MTTTDEAKRLNDTRMRAHIAARDVLEQAAREGRGLNASEKTAIARADSIIDDCQGVRADLAKRETAIRDLDGVRDESATTDC